MASSEAQREFDDLMRDKSRRHAHPEDESAQDQGFEPQENKPIEPTMPRPSMSSNRDKIPRIRYGANTGPKGVIADAQDYRDSRRTHRSARASMETTNIPFHSEPKFGQQLEIERLTLVEEQGELDDDSDDMDDEFVAQWRQQRLHALKQGQYQSTMHERASSGKKFGVLTAVDGDGYLEAVERSGPDVVVVVYIADSESGVSRLFEECLQELAGQHSKTRFIKLDYEEAEIHAEGVPGIIAYRNGDKFAALIPLMDELPDDSNLDTTTLTSLLQKYVVVAVCPYMC